MKSIHLLCAASLAAASAHGATVAWQGGNADWSTANWNVGGAANSNTSQTILNNNVSISEGIVTTGSNITAGDGGSTTLNTLSVVGTGQLHISGNLDFGTGKTPQDWKLGFSMADNAIVSADTMVLKTKNATINQTFSLSGGTLTLNSDNPITGGNFANVNFNITAAAGGFSLIHSNATDADKTLATKVGLDLFAIDGTNITVTADGTDIGALNTELALNIVNNKYFQVETSGITQTLVVASAVPEPSSTALLGLGGLALILRRRK